MSIVASAAVDGARDEDRDERTLAGQSRAARRMPEQHRDDRGGHRTSDGAGDRVHARGHAGLAGPASLTTSAGSAP